MSFQDFAIDKRRSSSSSSSAGRSSSQNPSQAVASGIFQINTSVSSFRRLVDAIGTSKDTPDHRQKLHSTRQRIGQLVKETSAKLKSLSDSHHNLDHVNPNKKIEDAKLARDFQATMQDFQKVQQLAVERESAYTPYAHHPSSSQASSSIDEQPGRDGNQEIQPFLGEQKKLEVLMLGNEIAFNEAIIDERDQGIRYIQEEIGQANEIFRDLAVLVHGQGVVIDDIGSNIESSAAVTANSKTHLSKAHKSVKSRASWCWWVLLVFVLVLAVFLLVLIL